MLLYIRYKTYNTKEGFVLSFSVLIAGVLLSIGLAIFSITLKELLLSSGGRESQFAFYAADSGGECALYWDIKHPGYSGSVFAPVSSASGGSPGEAGIIQNTDGSSWVTVNLENSYANPLVFAMTNTERGGQSPKLAQVRNVQSGSFEARMCEHENTDGQCDSHFAEDVGYVVLEQGVADDLSGVEAGSLAMSGGGVWDATTVNFNEDLGSNAVIIATQQTQNDAGEGIVQAVNVDSTSADLYLCDHHDGSEDRCVEGHGTEMVAWVAFDPNAISFTTTHQAGVTSMSSSEWTAQSFSSSFNTAPVVVGTIQTNNGGQQPKPTMARNVTTGGMDIRYCEHDEGDECDTHANETVGWFAVERGTIRSTEETSISYTEPVPQESGIMCNNEDISDPTTGWDPDIGWDTSVDGNATTTVFDMAFEGEACATVTVRKTLSTTQIDALGYNTCDPTDPRRVERGLRITY